MPSNHPIIMEKTVRIEQIFRLCDFLVFVFFVAISLFMQDYEDSPAKRNSITLDHATLSGIVVEFRCYLSHTLSFRPDLARSSA